MQTDRRVGVLPAHMLTGFIDSGFITGIPPTCVNPASVDLPLSDEAYRLVANFLPLQGETVRSVLRQVGATSHSLSAPLEVGVSYLIRIAGRVTLPRGVYGYVNPKSSTGRVNLHVVLVADGVPMYDALLAIGVRGGELWVLVTPSSFSVLVAPGLVLSQLRLFNGPSFLSPGEFAQAVEEHGLFYSPLGQKFGQNDVLGQGGSVFLTLSIKRGIIGWECRGTNRILDMTKVRHYPPEDFFTPVESDGNSVDLRPGGFYILSTEEYVCVPPFLSAELRAMDPRMGEFRAHTAGYIDSGWGWGEDGQGVGRPITLEFVMFKPLKIRPGQNVVRIRFERMLEPPQVPYDAANPHYTEQWTAALSKHFRAPLTPQLS